MADNAVRHYRPGRQAAASVTVVFAVAAISIYLAGFALAVELGPGLMPPVSTVLEYIYWPLVMADQNNIEPFNTAIQWLRRGK